jgi:hypothetical protein
MIALENKGPAALIMDLMLEALRVQDEKLNELAMELIARFGEQPVHQLTLEAVSEKNLPAHRIRALRTIRRVGIVTDAGILMDLLGLKNARNEEVRMEANTLIEALRLGRVAETEPDRAYHRSTAGADRSMQGHRAPG